MRQKGSGSALSILRGLDDPLRYAVVSRLMAGPETVSELLAHTGAAQSQLSNHLAILHAGGLVTRERVGRNVVYALAGPEIAGIIEAIDSAAGAGPQMSAPVPEVVLARHCYDHLAGRLGVGVFADLVTLRAVEPVGSAINARKVRSGLGDVALGPRAANVFGELGIELEMLAAQRRRFATACNDWTESRPHLAGALGAALHDACLRAGWLQRRSGTRALRITPRGRRELPERFGRAVAAVLS
jgi:DNA-binding transcriptional ArsR family regulator